LMAGWCFVLGKLVYTDSKLLPHSVNIFSSCNYDLL
jgi:hypothetical protein